MVLCVDVYQLSQLCGLACASLCDLKVVLVSTLADLPLSVAYATKLEDTKFICSSYVASTYSGITSILLNEVPQSCISPLAVFNIWYMC